LKQALTSSQTNEKAPCSFIGNLFPLEKQNMKSKPVQNSLYDLGKTVATSGVIAAQVEASNSGAELLYRHHTVSVFHHSPPCISLSQLKPVV
jgi:hypothetical protein